MKHRPILLVSLLFFLSFIIATGPVVGDDLAQFEGLIEPYELVDVGTPVEGVVTHINVQRSSSVHKGDPLVLLDSSVEEVVVERAQVLAEVEGELKLQKEKLAFARRMHTRVEELFKSEAISAEKYDQAAAEVTFARAQLQKARENRELARLDLTRAKAMLNQRTIKSPISGIVVERFVSPGEFVGNQPLLRVAQMDPLRVEVILPADKFRQIKPGMMADIVPETDPDGSYSSTVVIVDRVIDPASGTFGVRLELPNPGYRLPSGLKCTVRFLDETKIASPAKIPRTLEGDKVAKDSELEPLLITVVQ
ncbi:MAG: efflux RND transporter periplasmic adaptor subunit [Desulfobulbaceae bacterium]|nr:efflux RND transporter periplasmic adaptor subunit [Desulfobulbaceae bacterium]